MTNDGRDLIARFEANLTPESSFHHADHVRLAFEFLREYSVLEALSRFANALKRFAESRGKTQLYNETITYAYLFLIHERMARCEAATWENFARQNSDLLGWNPGILNRYYMGGTLQSDLARRVFLLPDKCLHAQDATAQSAKKKPFW